MAIKQIKNKHDLRYGGTFAGNKELNAIVKSVKQSIKTGNWQAGEQTRLFEQESAKFLGIKYGVVTISGSCAGLLALNALELPAGSEVIIPAVTFPTIFNIILQCNLIPVVVDVIDDYTLDLDEVEKAITKKTKAIIAIHPLGIPADMPRLMKLVKKYKQKIYVLEDFCDAWSSGIHNKLVGSFGDISITSFHAAHIVSMGVGGGVFTNNKVLAQKVRMYKDWGRQADINEPNKYKELPVDYNPRFIYEKIGYNFQILELQTAMGRVQLRRSNEIKRLRQKNANYLIKNLSQFEELIFPYPDKNFDICWFSLPITTTGSRGELVKYLENAGIETRSMFSGNICRHPAYQNSKFRVVGKLPIADYILEHSFWITVHPRLKKSDLDYIIKTFNEYFAK